MDIMARVAEKHLQTAYADLQKFLQQEWIFLPRVTLNIGAALQTIEDALRDAFLLALFKGFTSQIPWRSATGLSFKQYGIAIPDPT